MNMVLVKVVVIIINCLLLISLIRSNRRLSRCFFSNQDLFIIDLFFSLVKRLSFVNKK